MPQIEVSIDYISNLQKLMKETEAAAKKAGDSVGENLNKHLKEGEGHASKIGEIFKGIALERGMEVGIEALKKFGEFAIESTVKWEKNKAIMKSFVQDNVEAEMKMREMKEASHAAFDIDEMTKGFVNLKNAGLNPSTESLTHFVDISKSQGKSFEGFTGAVQHAMSGRYRALLEYGIKIKENNGKLETSFRGQKETIGATQKDLEAYINKIGELPGIAGSANTAMNTAGGAMTGVKESMEGLATAIGSYFTGPDGVFTKTLTGFKDFLEHMKKLAEKTEADMVKANIAGMQKVYETDYLTAAKEGELGDITRSAAVEMMVQYDPEFANAITAHKGDVGAAYAERMNILKNTNTEAEQREKYKNLQEKINYEATQSGEGEYSTAKDYERYATKILRKNGNLKENEQFSESKILEALNPENIRKLSSTDRGMLEDAAASLKQLHGYVDELKHTANPKIKEKTKDKTGGAGAGGPDNGNLIKAGNTIKELHITQNFEPKSFEINVNNSTEGGEEVRDNLANEIHKVMINVATMSKIDYSD